MERIYEPPSLPWTAVAPRPIQWHRGIRGLVAGIPDRRPANATPVNNSSTADIPISVTPVDGFTGGVNLKCALGSMPPGAVNLPICNFPIVLPTVTLTGAQPVRTLLSIATAGEALPGLASSNSTRPSDLRYLELIVLPATMLWLGFYPTEFPKKSALVRCLLLSGMLLETGCGGGSTVPKTTAGIYTFQIHGTDASSGKITADAIVTVDVQ